MDSIKPIELCRPIATGSLSQRSCLCKIPDHRQMLGGEDAVDLSLGWLACHVPSEESSRPICRAEARAIARPGQPSASAASAIFLELRPARRGERALTSASCWRGVNRSPQVRPCRSCVEHECRAAPCRPASVGSSGIRLIVRSRMRFRACDVGCRAPC